MASSTLSMEEKYPELFWPDQNVDPKTRTRTVPMEVLNFSFSRTGTVSVQTALQLLGIKTYHALLLFSNIRDCDIWIPALEAKFIHHHDTDHPPLTRQQWDYIFGPFGAVSDVPTICFADELIAAYPEAKVILVERDLESWYRSFSEQVIRPIFSFSMWLAAKVDPRFIGRLRQVHYLWVERWMGCYTEEEMQMSARDFYRRHYEHVRKICPPERLLDFKLSDGWGPLCGFLGKEVPAGRDFPWVNDAAVLQEKMELLVRKTMNQALRRWAGYAAPVVVLGLALWLSYWLLT